MTGRAGLGHGDVLASTRPLPDPLLPPGTDRAPEIAHVVILMMENHSFDNYLGTLGRGDGLPQVPPVNCTAEGEAVPSHPMPSTRQVRGVPSQAWTASHDQYADGRNDGFVASAQALDPALGPGLAMGYWTSTELPFYHSLAGTFSLADRWFCSCLGPTFPNRRFLIAATANGLVDDAMASIIDYPANGTIFDLLNRHGIGWANYHHVPGAHLLYRRAGGRGILRLARAAQLVGRRLLPSVDDVVRGEIRCTANLYPLGLRQALGHLAHIRDFFSHAASGTLPPVSIVDPDFSSCSEENPQDVQVGEGFAAAVVDAVMDGPGWPRTVLFWLYDEHGGYYDHVPPPEAVSPDDVAPHSLLDGGGPLGWVAKHFVPSGTKHRSNARGYAFDRYGFRVPAVVVSPYAKAGYVSSTVYDHTSVLKFIEEKWNLPPLTRRDAAARAPWDMLDLAAAPAFARPPRLELPARPWAGPGAH